MKHTPGPWSVWESPYGGARVHARHEKTIADVMSKGGAGKEEFEANSRLIAAAPELLDALVELASIVEGVRNGDGGVDSFTLQPARAAIAAATGQVAVGHVTYDWRTGIFECHGCRDRYQLTLPVPVTIETSVAKEYVRLHRKHKPKPVMP